METNSNSSLLDKFIHWMSTSTSLKLLVIGLIVLILLIPQYHIDFLRPVFPEGIKPALLGAYLTTGFPYGEIVLFAMLLPLSNAKQAKPLHRRTDTVCLHLEWPHNAGALLRFREVGLENAVAIDRQRDPTIDERELQVEACSRLTHRIAQLFHLAWTIDRP